ncbi:MAG: Ig-like domain-containing protein [Asgard group archaeon]|nr:Ig-like domain-containing protein [Asgard group archaeon]
MKKHKHFILFISIILLVGIIVPVFASAETMDIRVPPGASCTITNPTEGETVSGVVTITVDAYKDPILYIDGNRIGKYSNYDWDTTTYSDGSHTITAKAPGAEDSVTVTVDNDGGTTDNPPVVTIDNPTDGATVSDVVTISISITDEESLTADIYIDSTYIITANSYDWDTTTYADGSHTIYAEATDSAGQTGSDEVGVTVDNSGGSTGGDGIVNRWAVIVGISDYKDISDLSYCDEDASDWYWQLDGNSYSIELYGDGHTSDYPIHTGYATESNVKNAITTMINNADEDDIIVFASSGHGGGQTTGPPSSRSQYLCMWDCSAGENGEDGYLYDTELANLFASAVSQTFIFLDHCYAGGMNEVMENSNSDLIYMTTTCTDNGYGYDDPDSQNGLWTHYFLEVSWQNYYGGSFSVSMETVFAYAHDQYPYGGGDEPQEFDGNTSMDFYL